MARNDGVDRVTARNVNLADTKIANVQRHNEREKESYVTPIVIKATTQHILQKAMLNSLMCMEKHMVQINMKQV